MLPLWQLSHGGVKLKDVGSCGVGRRWTQCTVVKCHIPEGPEINSLLVTPHYSLCSHDASPVYVIYPEVRKPFALFMRIVPPSQHRVEHHLIASVCIRYLLLSGVKAFTWLS